MDHSAFRGARSVGSLPRRGSGIQRKREGSFDVVSDGGGLRAEGDGDDVRAWPEFLGLVEAEAVVHRATSEVSV